jgi:hypothetical protein
MSAVNKYRPVEPIIEENYLEKEVKLPVYDGKRPPSGI